VECLDENMVLALVDGSVDETTRAYAERHLASCADCSQIVAAAAGVECRWMLGGSQEEQEAGESSRSPDTALARGGRVGRYVILGLVGHGGMGDVYAAYDPQLDRKVALKLLHDFAQDSSGPARREQLLREAKLIARLSHPNVVDVHDAGTIADAERGDRAFIAMELVEGETLAKWLEAKPRDWRAICDVFAAAAQGLAAVHDAGLVHRDFKPQNVIVRRDGTVCVIDFGLAEDSYAMNTGAIDPTTSPSAKPPISRTVSATRAGKLRGTPLYMAPEQFLARGTDARTDQFSFCVALHEALYGEHPFRSNSFSALVEAVVGGRVRGPTRRGSVPPFLRRLTARGLSVDPDARWPSMHALLAQLRCDPSARQRALATTTIAVVVAMGVGLGTHRLPGRSYAHRTGRRRSTPVCADTPDTAEARGEPSDEMFAVRLTENFAHGPPPLDRCTDISALRVPVPRPANPAAFQEALSAVRAPRPDDIALDCAARRRPVTPADSRKQVRGSRALRSPPRSASEMGE
jgi:serine/threonine protein kinase